MRRVLSSSWGILSMSELSTATSPRDSRRESSSSLCTIAPSEYSFLPLPSRNSSAALMARMTPPQNPECLSTSTLLIEFRIFPGSAPVPRQSPPRLSCQNYRARTRLPPAGAEKFRGASQCSLSEAGLQAHRPCLPSPLSPAFLHSGASHELPGGQS